MGDVRVPFWFAALGSSLLAERVHGLFIQVLNNLPISSSELARRLGVAQPTVSRWSTGGAHASLAEMEQTLDTVAGCVEEIGETVERARLAFALIDRAVLLSECQCVPADPFCDTCSRRSNDAVRRELLETQARLEELLREVRTAEAGLDDRAS